MQEAFISKRNKVQRVGSVVEKTHQSALGAQFEADKLNKLYAQKINVPKLILHEENVLKMEYIEAPTIADLIDEWEKQPNPPVQDAAMEGLVKWLDGYCKASAGRGRGDINCRNFLFDGKNVWGVDFEDEDEGSFAENIGQLCAFILTYDPAHTPLKNELVSIIIKHSGLEPAQVDREKTKALELLSQRRRRK